MKKILLGRTVSKNLYYLKKMMEEDSFFEDYEIHQFDETGEKLTKDLISTFDLIITDSNPQNFSLDKFVKSKNQKIIQLSNGVWVKKPSPHIVKSKFDTDYILCPNNFSIQRLMSVGYKKEDLILDRFPRMGYYEKDFDQEEILKTLDSFGISREKKIVLFAPSWVSKDATLGAKKYNLDSIIENLNSDEFLIVAPHPLLFKNKIKYTSKRKNSDKYFVIETTYNKDKLNISGDLIMPIASKLITDYSSIIFDFISLYPDRENEFHFSENDKMLSLRMRFGYKMQYLFWGRGTSLNRKIKKAPKEYAIFNKNDNEPLLSKIKEILLN